MVKRSFFKLDLLPPIISLSETTATTFNISWTQPADSLPAMQYEISLTRVTGGRQLLCDAVIDSRSPFITSNNTMEFKDLHSFSIYSVTIIITIPSYGINSTTEFSTLPAGKF